MTRTSMPDFEQGTLNAYLVSPSEVKPADRYGYKVICIIDDLAPCWAAYKGPTSWTDDQVERNGDKLPEKVAVLLFPSIQVYIMSKKGFYNT